MRDCLMFTFMIIIAVLVIALALAAVYLVVVGITWLICFGFNLAWSWQFALGVFGVVLAAVLLIELIRG